MRVCRPPKTWRTRLAATQIGLTEDGIAWSRRNTSRFLAWHDITQLRARSGALELKGSSGSPAVTVPLDTVGQEDMRWMLDRIGEAAVARADRVRSDGPVAFDYSRRIVRNSVIVIALTAASFFFSVIWYVLGLLVSWRVLRMMEFLVSRIAISRDLLELTAIAGLERIPLRTIREVRLEVLPSGMPVVIIESSAGTRMFGGFDELLQTYAALRVALRELPTADAPVVYELIPFPARRAGHLAMSMIVMAVLLLLIVADRSALPMDQLASLLRSLDPRP